MKSTIIQSLTDNFESHAKKTENAVEFWLARDLQQLLGYEKWDNFKNIISKAKTACELSDSQIADHLLMSGLWSQILVLESVALLFFNERKKELCSLVMKLSYCTKRRFAKKD